VTEIVRSDQIIEPAISIVSGLLPVINQVSQDPNDLVISRSISPVEESFQLIQHLNSSDSSELVIIDIADLIDFILVVDSIENKTIFISITQTWIEPDSSDVSVFLDRYKSRSTLNVFGLERHIHVFSEVFSSDL
jgi:hypothetical protein